MRIPNFFYKEKRQKIRVDREKVDLPSQKNNDFLDNIFIVDLYITKKRHTSRHFFYDLDTKNTNSTRSSTRLNYLFINYLQRFLLIRVDFYPFSTVKNKSKTHYNREREIGNFNTLTQSLWFN